MSEPQIRKPKQSFWTTIRIGWGPYRRLFGYAMPYKVRLIIGLAFGFLAGFITSLMPLVLARVASVVFHGATPSPTTLATHPELMDKGPPINSLVLLCLAIPAVMIARSLCGYVNTYYMTWVSAKVLTDIRTQLFGKMLSHSMDFFNKIQSGFLMSRITNDTQMMQAALSSVSSDLFKQPVAIVGGIALALRRYVRHQRSVDARYKALIDQANDGIVIVDAHSHQVLYTNPAFLSRLGYSNEEAQSLTLTDIFVDGNATPDSVLSRLIEADSQMAINLQQRCKNGAFFDTEVRCNALDVDGRDVLAYVTHDVSLRRKAEQQLIENQQRLDKMAHHDQLTGLPNRHYLTGFLPQAIEEAKAASTMLGVVFLDLDRFKHINDTRGHETGDKLLQEVAARLRSCVRDSDVVIRMGGDEFVVVFRNVKNYDEVTLGAGRIIETLNRPIIIDRHPLQTTGSVGVSLYPRDGTNMLELLKHSDTAMYQAKDRGRNNVQMFSHAMNRKLKHRVAVEASLREALRLKQLDVHYQPFINLLTRKVVGLEALMRWRMHGGAPGAPAGGSAHAEADRLSQAYTLLETTASASGAK